MRAVIKKKVVRDLNASFNGEKDKPCNPSKEKSKRNAMAGFGAKICDDLWDFCNSPTH